MTASNLRLIVFDRKTASKGGPETTSMCFVVIIMISVSFCHIFKW